MKLGRYLLCMPSIAYQSSGKWIYMRLLFILWIYSTFASDEATTTQCPASCKCSPVEESQPPAVTAEPVLAATSTTSRVPIMARCWIPANMVQLPCEKSWTIVHLQILTGQAQPDHLTPSLTARPIGGRTGYPNISVSPKLFEQCGSLTRLAIWERSQFTWLPQYWLRPLVKLERLLIEVPTLQILPDHFFAFLPRLNFVKISKCSQLSRISRAVFEPCPETLHTVWLDGNGLRGKLPAGVFRQCNFRMLHLSENQLTQLDWGSLSGLSQLQSLQLQRNRLIGSLEQCLSYRKDMNSTALAATPMLKKLDLSFNQIESIEGILWSGECVRSQAASAEGRGLCHLEELNLGHNHLKWLALDSFNGLPRLRRLNLDFNPGLFSPEGSANMALVLYAVSVVNKHFQSLIIPIQNAPHQGQQRPRSNGSIDLCQPDDSWLSQAPQYLAMTANHVKRSSCNRYPLPEFELDSSSPHMISTDHVTTEGSSSSINQTSVFTHTNSQSDEESDPILAFVRHTNRFNLLILCLGLIFVGLLIGLLPMAYFLCTPKPRDQKTKSNPSSNMMPLLVHPGSETGFILSPPSNQINTNSPNGSMSTPLPKRSIKNGRNGALPPIPPTRVHFASSRVPILHGSADPIRARALIQPTMVPTFPVDGVPAHVVRARRVHSTSNVYHRTHPQNGSNNAQHHRYDRLAPQDSPIPMELHPLHHANRTTVCDVPYCPTEDTVVSGSTYSLATVTSLRGRSPAKGGTIVPTTQPAVV